MCRQLSVHANVEHKLIKTLIQFFIIIKICNLETKAHWQTVYIVFLFWLQVNFYISKYVIFFIFFIDFIILSIYIGYILFLQHNFFIHFIFSPVIYLYTCFLSMGDIAWNKHLISYFLLLVILKYCNLVSGIYSIYYFIDTIVVINPYVPYNIINCNGIYTKLCMYMRIHTHM